MSIEMRQIPFVRLMEEAMGEYEGKRSFFGVPVCPARSGAGTELFGSALESPVGPAAGPHTQLAQNLIAGYGAGARFFELKTVQVLWGEELGIQRPCIYVRDEAYNVEWSTELSPRQAAEEYIKAWVAIKLLSREYGLGDPEGFVFNLSVGYDLPGIQSRSVDDFLNTMKDATGDPCFTACLEAARGLPLRRVDGAYIDAISPRISNNSTISTMHGCPPEQIRSIGAYMMEEKGLHTSIKCNPTLLGPETCRRLLDGQGYEDIRFDDAQFEHDMKLQDALVMLGDLMDVGERCGLRFGVKLTNTFPVRIERGELPGDTMYLSGKALFPLSLSTAILLSEATRGRLPISYSGGADASCVAELFAAGVWPITVATVLMKPGGYKNLTKLAAKCAGVAPHAGGVDAAALAALRTAALEQGEHFRRREPKKAPGGQPPFSCGRCSTCVDVCPNRANRFVEGLERQVVHLDGPCNDCGCCESLCPFGLKPYADKFVLYPDRETLLESERDGFVILPGGYLIRWQGRVREDAEALPEQARRFMDAVRAMNPAQ